MYVEKYNVQKVREYVLCNHSSLFLGSNKTCDLKSSQGSFFYTYDVQINKDFDNFIRVRDPDP